MGENNISFKATVNGLILIMPAEDDFDTVLSGIEKKLESSGRFFKGASLAVKYRGRKLTAEQESTIVKLLSDKTDAEIRSFEEDTSQYEKEPDNSSDRTFDRPKMKMVYFKGLEEGMTKFYNGTVRSGQLISYEGNIVIIGDVNPGGEVIAAGNVVVMGALRGMVHAGADGNKEAVIAALSLQPTQLRIADVITRPPDAEGERENKNQCIPEMAFVKDNLVYIERFLPQYK
jgi:septum site-determining protein MinC